MTGNAKLNPDWEKIVTIDPGISGGIALWAVDFISKKQHLLGYDSMPIDAKTSLVDGGELADMFDNATTIYIEKVGSMPGNAGQAMFNFGVSNGIVIGVAQSMEAKIEFVSPNSWMNVAHAGLLRSQLSKDRSIYICMRDLGITLKKSEDGIADAICLGIAIATINEREISYDRKRKRK